MYRLRRHVSTCKHAFAYCNTRTSQVLTAIFVMVGICTDLHKYDTCCTCNGDLCNLAGGNLLVFGQSMVAILSVCNVAKQ